MLFEVVGFWGLICLACFAFAEFKDDLKIIGFVGGALLIILGLMIATGPIQVKTGELTTSIESANLTGPGTQTGTTVAIQNSTSNTVTVLGITTDNTTSNTTTTYNLIENNNSTTNTSKTINNSYVYSNVVFPTAFNPYNMGQILGIILMLIGAMACLKYALNLVRA